LGGTPLTVERIAITDREQWLALRRQDITASDVAIVCGEGAYGSAAELYAEKKGLRPPLVDSGVLRRGRWGEASVFEALQDEHPDWETRRAKNYWRDPELRLGATPDGFAMDPTRRGHGIVQAKTVSRYIFRHRWMVDPDDDIKFGDAAMPESYRLQTTTEAMLTDANWACLAVLINSEFDWEFRLFDVPRDAELEDRIRYNVLKFWHDYLDAGIMPPFDPQRDEQLLKILYPKDTGATVDLTVDNRAQAVVEEFIVKRDAITRLKKELKPLQTELTAKLGDATFGQLADGRRLQWRNEPRRGHVVKPSNPRVFRIVGPEKPERQP
jgi:predicted phage-related endonuclease